nr:cyclophilin-like fold protein [uncultured Albidiferax sp.]
MSVFAQEPPMKIRLHVHGEVATATLAATATARDFAALLPLSITLRDFAKVERIGDLPRKLSTVGAPAGLDPVLGDIAYYAPLNHLVVFAGDNVYADGLVRMGRVDTGLAALQRPGPLQVRIERIAD